MATLRDQLHERRLDRMRNGQAVADRVTLLSDPEIVFSIVPLTEAEYMNALQVVASGTVPDSLLGAEILDRRRAQETLIRAIREPGDLMVRVFDAADDLLEIADQADIDHMIDRYNEMVAQSSPSLDGIPPEEFVNLKELLQKMDWNALSGRSWYAAQRFLGLITPSPLLDNSPGSTSIKPLTTTND